MREVIVIRVVAMVIVTFAAFKRMRSLSAPVWFQSPQEAAPASFVTQRRFRTAAGGGM